MTFCNRCKAETESLLKTEGLDLYLCDDCAKSFDRWMADYQE